MSRRLRIFLIAGTIANAVSMLAAGHLALRSWHALDDAEAVVNRANAIIDAKCGGQSI